MEKFRTPADRDQIMLLPRSIDEYVGAEDTVRYVDAFVDELDLSAMEDAYSELGRPGFSPGVMVKILLYGKMRGMRSSRELARAVRENVRFMFIASGEQPDFRTISLFRKRFCRELSGLLRQTIDVGLREGLINLEHVTVDGTVIRAYAGRRSFRRAEQLRALEAALERSFEKDIEMDEREDEERGDDDGEGMLPTDLRDRERLRAKVKAALEQEAEVEQKRKHKGKNIRQISLTDPECRYIQSHEGRQPSYNGQVAVDVESRLVVGGYATNAVSDNGELPELLANIEANTGKNPKVLSADRGYSLKAGLAELKERRIDGFIPQREEKSAYFKQEDFCYDEDAETYRCPNNRVLHYRGDVKHKRKQWRKYVCEDCAGCPVARQCMQNDGSRRTLHISIYSGLYYEMREKTRTALGRRMARIRASTVEPTFGHIKANRKLRQFYFRGRAMVDAMWKLELASYNIEKLIRLRLGPSPVI
jgi:transposase